jgi:hypothetical protein
VHPHFRQSNLLALDTEHGILNQAWSPIGGITFYRDGSQGSTLEDPVITRIASQQGKSPALLLQSLLAGASTVGSMRGGQHTARTDGRWSRLLDEFPQLSGEVSVMPSETSLAIHLHMRRTG